MPYGPLSRGIILAEAKNIYQKAHPPARFLLFTSGGIIRCLRERCVLFITRSPRRKLWWKSKMYERLAGEVLPVRQGAAGVLREPD